MKNTKKYTPKYYKKHIEKLDTNMIHHLIKNKLNLDVSENQAMHTFQAYLECDKNVSLKDWYNQRWQQDSIQSFWKSSKNLQSVSITSYQPISSVKEKKLTDGKIEKLEKSDKCKFNNHTQKYIKHLHKQKPISNKTIIETSQDLIDDKTLKLDNLNSQVRKIKNNLLIGDYSKQSEIDKKEKLEKLTAEIKTLQNDIEFCKKIKKNGRIPFTTRFKDKIENPNGIEIFGFYQKAKISKSILKRKSKKLSNFVEKSNKLIFLSHGSNPLTCRYGRLSKRYRIRLKNEKNEFASDYYDDKNTTYDKDSIENDKDFMRYVRINYNHLLSYGIQEDTLRNWKSGRLPSESYTEDLVMLKRYVKSNSNIQFNFGIYKEIDKNLEVSIDAPYVVQKENEPYTISVNGQDIALDINSLSYAYHIDGYKQYINNDITFVSLLYQCLQFFCNHDCNLWQSCLVIFNDYFHNQGWSVRLNRVQSLESENLGNKKTSYDQLIEKRDSDTDYIGISDLSKI